MKCNRDQTDHCCYIEGKRCGFLLEGDSPKWTCSLMAKYKDWKTVHKSKEYAEIAPVWKRLGIKDCGDYFCENCIDGDA